MILPVHPKKSLGQHFLKDENIARKIVGSLPESPSQFIEIGPGTGVLTKYLFERPGTGYYIETDQNSIKYLAGKYSDHERYFIHGDFLKTDPGSFFEGEFSIIGNFPYNISSPILFKILEHRDRVRYLVGMVQKEVAERITSKPGSKKYGILSVLLQAFYQTEYLFTVNETVFLPPPKVKSAVIRLSRNQVTKLSCDEEIFFKIVKSAFNQRRKILRNSLRSFIIDFDQEEIMELAGKRPEQLGISEFVALAKYVV